MHISSADKKEKPWFLKALKTRRNPFFDKTVRKTGFIHLSALPRMEYYFRVPNRFSSQGLNGMYEVRFVEASFIST